ncbi:basement membrane-specific heparan sulfate proteoglycan core protein-like [Mytilus trossulus]|uniref:basement membrane-specific heparan sulfate proteoglycan core protein-like n=1 Tax=Mytilus trossulus TaxID=6551 RepID=UPI0030055A8A
MIYNGILCSVVELTYTKMRGYTVFCNFMTISTVVYLLRAELIDDPKGAGQDALPILVNWPDKNVQITCTKQKDQVDDKILWYHGEHTFISYGAHKPSNNDYSVKKNSYGEIELTIKKISKGTLGKYSCVNGNTNRKIKTVELKIIEKPSIVNHSNTTLTITEGNTTELWCEVESVIEYKIDWFLHDDRLDLPVGINGSRLTIVNITRHCSAIYRCLVTNAKGNNSVDFDVIVIHKPMVKIEVNTTHDNVVTKKTDVKISKKKKITVECIINAEPRTDYIEWSVGKKRIGSWNKTSGLLETYKPFKARYILTKDEPTISSAHEILKLQILKPSKDDVGTFKCSATNTVDSQTAEVELV